MLPTTPQKATHDYARNGTLDLFAALNIATGTVITDLRSTHTAADFISFLNKIDREFPADLDVHVILDNLSTHKTPKVHHWLLRHRRFHFHFTPTYGSWMNLVGVIGLRQDCHPSSTIPSQESCDLGVNQTFSSPEPVWTRLTCVSTSRPATARLDGPASLRPSHT